MTTPTAHSVLPALQEAVYARLAADDELRELGWGVCDAVDEDAEYPLVQVGEATETPDDTHDTFGRNVLLVLHLWSRYRGYTEATAALDRLVALLDHQPLTVTGHRVIVVRFVDALTVPDPDPTIRHVPVRFRVLTEQEQE